MGRYLVTLKSAADRERAIEIVNAAPSGSRVEVKAAKRSLPQNDRMWAMLTDISRQVIWDGQKRTPDKWKILFLAGLRDEELVPSLDGTGFVNIGNSSSDLSKEEMSDMIELMNMFGAKHGVAFHDEALQ